MALALAIIGLAVGIALGLRFKIVILVPAIGIAEIFARPCRRPKNVHRG